MWTLSRMIQGESYLEFIVVHRRWPAFTSAVRPLPAVYGGLGGEMVASEVAKFA